VRFIWGRALRLELVAGLSFGLGMSASAWSAVTPRTLSTETTLTAETQDLNGHTQASVTVSVTGQDGRPAHGAVVIADHGSQLAGVGLDANGHAITSLSLLPGDHLLTAIYGGDSTHLNSVSDERPVHAVTGTTADFSVAVSPASISLEQGQSGAVTASVTPINASSLTAPMFVTLSCSGLPDQSSCTFTPENIEILPNATAAVTSSMDLATSAQGQIRKARVQPGGAPRVSWAILLPGTLCLAGIAFGVRRRRWLARISLLAVVGLVGVLGTTGCDPLYNYHNHGPSVNLPTPAGTYTLLITAQSSNGITAITHSTTMVLTVQ
jgi:Bacterial Ig-like domain (group 3)